MDLKSMMEEMNKEMQDPSKFEDDGASKFKRDERLFVIGKDKDGNGSAKIRFLPSLNADKNKLVTFVKVKRHRPEIKDGDKKRFIDEICPKTFDNDADCPICDYTWDNYNELKDVDEKKAKWYPRTFASKDRYYSNILCIDDKENPENNGKIFILEYGSQLSKMINKAMNPSEEEIEEKNAKPFNAWDLLKGRDFRLKLTSGKHTENGFPTWENSFFATESTPFVKSLEEAEKVLDDVYCLDEFISPENIPSVEKLQERLDYVLGKRKKKSNTSSNEGQQIANKKGDDKPPFDMDTTPSPTIEEKMKVDSPKQKEVDVKSASSVDDIEEFFSQF